MMDVEIETTGKLIEIACMSLIKPEFREYLTTIGNPFFEALDDFDNMYRSNPKTYSDSGNLFLVDEFDRFCQDKEPASGWIDVMYHELEAYKDGLKPF